MALSRKNNATNPFISRGDEYMAKNMPKQALGEYLKSILKDTSNIKTHLKTSIAYKELEEYDRAIKHLESAKKLDAFDYEIYLELGINHLLNSDFGLAGKNFRKTITLNPDCLEAQIRLATAHELMDEPSMAFSIYEKIIEQAPEYILAHHHKAALLMSFGDFEQAASVFFDILKIDDSYAKAYLGLGICFDKLEKYTQAVRFYKKYITKDPKSQTVKAIASRMIDIVSAVNIKPDCKLRVAK